MISEPPLLYDEPVERMRKLNEFLVGIDDFPSYSTAMSPVRTFLTVLTSDEVNLPDPARSSC